MTASPGRRSAVEVHRGAARPVTRTATTTSRHALSFGAHYDPGNTTFGPVLACNEELVAPGGGFAAHPHRELEIVTWVLEGALRHEDDTGRQSVVRAGGVQVLSAGTGTVHSETNDAWRLDPALPRDAPLRFLQVWLAPAARRTAPAYATAEPSGPLPAGRLTAVVSGLPEVAAPLPVGAPAALLTGRVGPGAPVALPDAPLVLLLVTRGAVELAGTALDAGDQARLTAAGPHEVRAHPCAEPEPAEMLVWQLQPSPRAAG